MEIIDLHGQKEFSTTHAKASSAFTRMVLYRVQAGPERSAKALPAWPTH